jgi:hypothetical protein
VNETDPPTDAQVWRRWFQFGVLGVPTGLFGVLLTRICAVLPLCNVACDGAVFADTDGRRVRISFDEDDDDNNNNNKSSRAVVDSSSNHDNNHDSHPHNDNDSNSVTTLRLVVYGGHDTARLFTAVREVRSALLCVTRAMRLFDRSLLP